MTIGCACHALSTRSDVAGSAVGANSIGIGGVAVGGQDDAQSVGGEIVAVAADGAGSVGGIVADAELHLRVADAIQLDVSIAAYAAEGGVEGGEAVGNDYPEHADLSAEEVVGRAAEADVAAQRVRGAPHGDAPALGQLEVGQALQAVPLGVGLRALVDGRHADAVEQVVAGDAGGAGVVGVCGQAVERDAEIALQVETEDAAVAPADEAQTVAPDNRVAGVVEEEEIVEAAQTGRARCV